MGGPERLKDAVRQTRDEGLEHHFCLLVEGVGFVNLAESTEGNL